ncbi:hypothetical protein CEP52_013876 [Fusarium oligoseptatum]|uniref:BTB domain-containing protein n=1 Tax=Fusarium oligoseptatum TaxID=2604345 RepID=A0A428SRB9_9HYPO|nr:hypothetical protein CEP52_013876 [Fusarium oligoseptatum]
MEKEVETPEAKESGKNKPVSRWARTAERLATSEMKTAAMKKLLAEVDGPLKFLRPFGYFCYGFEHEFRLHGAVFAERAVGTQAPIFAFMQRGMIRIQREGVFSLPRPRRPNPPAELIRKMRLKQLEPSDPWCDPYILAVLIGLAQSQSQNKSLEKDSGSKGRPDAFKVCAVLVDETNTDMMGFYAATIPTEFLSKFEYPDGLKPTKETLSSSLYKKETKPETDPKNPDSQEDGPQSCFKVSMKHLVLASPRAKKMFGGNFAEAQPDEHGFRRWTFEPVFDPAAFEVVMNAIHGHTHKLPRTVSLNMLVSVSVIVDDLDCAQSLWFFAKTWIHNISQNYYVGTTADWILISYVFDEPSLFKSNTESAILHGRGPFQHGGLPIRPKIID